MREAIVLLLFLAVSGVLIFLGRDLFLGSALLNSALAFLSVTAAAVMMTVLYRVNLQLKASRHELARKDAELTFAHEVQSALFPRTLPRGNGLRYFGVCLPARGISGDYYDALALQDGNEAFAIADISGKGISAAILMSNLQALLRRETASDPLPSELCKSLNYHLSLVCPPAGFATMFYGRWSGRSRQLSYINAGHNRPLLFRSFGEPTELAEGGFPLGLFPEAEYESGSVTLEKGDLLLLYSDGVTESCSPSDQEFGCSRLVQSVNEHRGRPLEEIAQRILKEARDWSGPEAELQDDMTLLLIRVVAEGEA